MCYPVCWMVHIEEPLLLIRKIAHEVEARVSSLAIRSGALPYVRCHIKVNKIVSSASLTKTFPSKRCSVHLRRVVHVWFVPHGLHRRDLLIEILRCVRCGRADVDIVLGVRARLHVSRLRRLDYLSFLRFTVIRVQIFIKFKLQVMISLQINKYCT